MIKKCFSKAKEKLVYKDAMQKCIVKLDVKSETVIF
jgi:hypothetical protein